MANVRAAQRARELQTENPKRATRLNLVDKSLSPSRTVRFGIGGPFAGAAEPNMNTTQ